MGHTPPIPNPDGPSVRLQERGPNEIPTNRIIIEPAMLIGIPTIRGTQLRMEFLIGLMARGWDGQDGFVTTSVASMRAFSSA